MIGLKKNLRTAGRRVSIYVLMQPAGRKYDISQAELHIDNHLRTRICLKAQFHLKKLIWLRPHSAQPGLEALDLSIRRLAMAGTTMLLHNYYLILKSSTVSLICGTAAKT